MKNLWEKWKRLARKIGDFQGRLILTLFYFVIISPFALVVRWAADPLSIKPNTHRGWCEKAESKGSHMDRALNQF